MPTARWKSSCGVVRKSEDGTEEVVVAGGCDNNNRLLDVVEVYSIKEDKWRTGGE
jgi:hypothetical protein